MGILFLFGPQLDCELCPHSVNFFGELQPHLSDLFLASCKPGSPVPALVLVAIGLELVFDPVELVLDPVVAVLDDLGPVLVHSCCRAEGRPLLLCDELV